MVKPGAPRPAGGKGKASFKVANKSQNKEKRQRFRGESAKRRAGEAADDESVNARQPLGKAVCA